MPQTLNINKLRSTSAKSINLHTIRKFIEYSSENFLIKAMFPLDTFEILLFKGRSVLSLAQRGTESERVNFLNFFCDKTLKSVSFLYVKASFTPTFLTTRLSFLSN